MSEQQPNESISFSRFADWCRNIDSLSERAKHTVKVLLKNARTGDAEAAERILSSMIGLDLNNNQITDISSLGSLTNLMALYLGNNQITDISSLGSLTNLMRLHLGNNQITDISSLSSLTNLTELLLCDNQITDISSLSSLTNLTELYLRNNQITDISALRSLTNLTTLILDSDKIAVDLNVLGELAQKRLILSTRPIDAEKATAAVKVAYATIGLKEPEVIVCSSPREAYRQIFNLLKRNGSQNWSNKWCWNISGEKLDLGWNWQWMYPSIVGQFASPGVWLYEINCMTIESAADSTLSSLMMEFVNEYEYERSQETITNCFPDEDELSQETIMSCYPNDLFSVVPPETSTDLLKEIYLTELYVSSLGINLSERAQEIHDCQKQLWEHCGWIFPFEKICVVCDRPRHLRFDSQNRLHAEAEPAIEFADGWNFYYYHGVKLPEKYGQVHPDLWKAEWLLSEHNAELKRVLIEGIGYDRIIQELAAEQIDNWQEYALLKIDNADVEPIYLLKMTCPSTGFIHALRVPPNLTSAREAICWVNGGIDPEEFSVQT
jgi:Leucine Rich repeats (2 copies)